MMMSSNYLIIGIVIAIACYLLFLRPQKTRGDVDIDEDDAAKFARLLALNIKLYNAEKLERGLRDEDVYGELKSEIEDARKAYRRRIPNADLQDLFAEQIVEHLAGGDLITMGKGFAAAQRRR